MPSEPSAELRRQQLITQTVDKIRRSLDIQTIFETTTQEVRQLIDAERVVIYRFNQDWSGEFVVEAMADGWTSLLYEQTQQPELNANISECSLKSLATIPVTDTYLQDTKGGRFSRGELFRACNDIYAAGFSECYVRSLESYQARAYAIFAIYCNQKLWGLLAAFQNSAPRHWQADEIDLLTQISTQLGIALQQAEYLQQVQAQAQQLAQASERQRALADTIDQIRRSLNIETIFETTTQAVRQLLDVERVVIYRFNPDWSGEFVGDSILGGWTPPTTLFGTASSSAQLSFEGNPRNEAFVPISQGETLWGLLIAYQSSCPRYWEDEEISLLAQVGDQLGIALQQAELLKRTQSQTLQLQNTLRELQKTQSQLIHGEKMAGLGQLVAGIAHEINNPVSFIRGNVPHARELMQNLFGLVQLYQQKYPHADPEIQQYTADLDLDYLLEDLPKLMESMEVGAQRIQGIVESLRNFSRLDEVGVKTVDLHEGIDSTLMILTHRLNPQPHRPGIEVIKQYGNLPTVDCYVGELNQVFMSLLTNAIDAIDEMANPDCKPKILIQTMQLTSGDIWIAIADNGPGIPAKIQSRLFDPFFTTKPVGQGTGLGLSISYQIITELHGGSITCCSTSEPDPEQGSQFVIQIPASQILARR